jgi:hypothetical protein
LVPGVTAEDIEQPIAVEIGDPGRFERRAVVDRLFSPTRIDDRAILAQGRRVDSANDEAEARDMRPDDRPKR